MGGSASSRSGRVVAALACVATLLVATDSPARATSLATPAGVASAEPPSASVVPVGPERVLDTRVMRYATERGPRGGLVPADSSVRLDVLSASGVPRGTATVVVNLTATDAARAGHLTAYACGTDRPATSNVNFERGTPTAGTAFVRVGVGGLLCVYTSAPVALVVDVTGFVPAELDAGAEPPARIADTRSGPRLAAGEVLVVHPPTSDTVVTVTATQSSGSGLVYVGGCVDTDPADYPAGPRPGEIGPLNTRAGATSAITTIVSAPAVCVMPTVDTHVVIDVQMSTLPLDSRSSARLVDTRWDGAPIPAGGDLVFDPAAHPDARTLGSIALVVTATGASGTGYVTVHPADSTAGLASVLNPIPGAAVSNLVIVDGSRPTVFETSVATHLVVDLVATLQPAATASTPASAPSPA